MIGITPGEVPGVGDAAGVTVTILGLASCWRAMHGGPGGRQSLIRKHIDMANRIEGWRYLLLGLTLIGIGVALIVESRGLLVLALGFGFVELHEATHILRAWRWNGDMNRRPQLSISRSPNRLSHVPSTIDRQFGGIDEVPVPDLSGRGKAERTHDGGVRDARR